VAVREATPLNRVVSSELSVRIVVPSSPNPNPSSVKKKKTHKDGARKNSSGCFSSGLNCCFTSQWSKKKKLSKFGWKRKTKLSQKSLSNNIIRNRLRPYELLLHQWAELLVKPTGEATIHRVLVCFLLSMSPFFLIGNATSLLLSDSFFFFCGNFVFLFHL
jgi:hypothetical protein